MNARQNFASYSTNPVLDAERFTTREGNRADALERAEILLADEFKAAVRTGRLTAPALFAADTPDWNAPRKADNRPYMRHQTVAEVMADSLDYSNGPQMIDLMSLLCRVAAGEVQTAQARNLINQMAETYAKHNAECDE